MDGLVALPIANVRRVEGENVGDEDGSPTPATVGEPRVGLEALPCRALHPSGLWSTLTATLAVACCLRPPFDKDPGRVVSKRGSFPKRACPFGVVSAFFFSLWQSLNLAGRQKFVHPLAISATLRLPHFRSRQNPH